MVENHFNKSVMLPFETIRGVKIEQNVQLCCQN
jgi:hypothetical protein